MTGDVWDIVRGGDAERLAETVAELQDWSGHTGSSRSRTLVEERIPRHFLAALLSGDLVPADVVGWANEYRRSVGRGDLNPLVAKLASSNPKTVQGCDRIVGLLRQLADVWHPEFRNLGPLADEVAKETLARTGRGLLERRISPCQFCSFVRQFDAVFLGRRPGRDGVIPYPKWLGNLRGACDWVGDGWQPTLGEVPALANEVRSLLAELPDDDTDLTDAVPGEQP